ncbi:hypothetical protein N665_0418s0013 [Sinapis alba]|nr:hypothetical protein N665_0418s0013 [Sinapis alba]
MLSSLASMSWNCQGIGSDLTVYRLRKIISKISPDILFFMKTKNQEEKVLKHFRSSDFINHFLVPPIGLSGGLSLSWKDSVHLEILSSSANCIDTSIQVNNKIFFVLYVYESPNREDRAQLWENLTLLDLSRNDSPWLITGDFNDFLDNSETIVLGTSPLGGFFSLFLKLHLAEWHLGPPTFRKLLIKERYPI